MVGANFGSGAYVGSGAYLGLEAKAITLGPDQILCQENSLIWRRFRFRSKFRVMQEKILGQQQIYGREQILPRANFGSGADFESEVNLWLGAKGKEQLCPEQFSRWKQILDLGREQTLCPKQFLCCEQILGWELI